MVGRRLGRFTVLSQLGQGGMASVWRARDALSGRDVALKVLSETLASSPDARRRFRREAEIAALLDHPSIAAVYDAGEQDDAVWLAMALIDGRTLSDRLEAGLPPVAPALRALALAAEALGYAHGRGVLHRDVSSRNIMLGDDGRVFVLDFGLARALDRSRLSSSGARLGTIAFMSPEVMRGEEADPRSDLYGLGITAYHYLTGNFPFTGERDEVVVYERLNTPIAPPSALRAELGTAVDDVLVRALAREPGERWQTAAGLAAALRALAEPRAGANGHATSATAGAPERAADLASRIAAGSAAVYLAVPPFEDDASREASRVAAGLADAAAAGLAQIERVHVVPAAGANLLLRGKVRASGTAVRVSFALIEPESGVQIGGGMIDGSSTALFEVEDRLVTSLRRALGAADAPAAWRPRAHDPAAAEKYALALRDMSRFDNEASLEGAVARIEGLLQTEGDSAVLHATLARACTHLYRLTSQRSWETRAVSACDRARTIDPDADAVALATADLHIAAGRHGEALAELGRLAPATPERYDAALVRAVALDGVGRTPEAEAECQRAIGERPGDWRAYHTLGMLLFRHGHYAQAVGPWRRITELLPDNASAHRNLGSAYSNMGRFEDAVHAFRASNAIRPNAPAYQNLGTVLYHLERYEECVSALETAVALNPSDPMAWGNLGSACRFIPGLETRMREALGRAIDMLRERLDREPGTGETWARLASWHANLDQTEAALKAIDQALEMSPTDAYCMVTAAVTYLELNRRSDALRWLERAVENGYGVGLLRRKRTLRALEGDPAFERILSEGSRRQGVEVQPGNGG